MKKFIKENKLYLITMILIIIISNIRLPYYVDAPGGIININDRIVTDTKTEYEGSLNMLYVTQYQATVPIYLMSYLIKDWDLESITENQISNETYEEIDARNKIMLNNSIANATYVAYKEAGKQIDTKSIKHLVVATLKDDINIKIGDEILQINDIQIDNLNDIKKIIDTHNIGDTLKIKLNRNSKTIEVNTKISNVEGQKALGIVVMSNYEYETNPNIELKFRNGESGSSGGLMMSLSIYSAISGKDILKGRNIAGTGTIDIDGTVGPIDGIKYKIIGAVKNNIDIVLVPSGNYKEAQKVVKEKNYNIKLVEVKTFKDAISYLSK